jgi:hypothetical protein
MNVLSAVQAYDEEVLEVLREAVLSQLCGQVEGDLRIHLHASHQLGAPLGPSDRAARSVAPLLRLPTLRLPTRALNIRYGRPAHQDGGP